MFVEVVLVVVRDVILDDTTCTRVHTCVKKKNDESVPAP